MATPSCQANTAVRANSATSSTVEICPGGSYSLEFIKLIELPNGKTSKRENLDLSSQLCYQVPIEIGYHNKSQFDVVFYQQIRITDNINGFAKVNDIAFNNIVRLPSSVYDINADSRIDLEDYKQMIIEEIGKSGIISFELEPNQTIPAGGWIGLRVLFNVGKGCP